jgi:hypothetical protein
MEEITLLSETEEAGELSDGRRELNGDPGAIRAVGCDDLS